MPIFGSVIFSKASHFLVQYPSITPKITPRLSLPSNSSEFKKLLRSDFQDSIYLMLICKDLGLATKKDSACVLSNAKCWEIRKIFFLAIKNSSTTSDGIAWPIALR
jgi:hypothetical protein